MGPTSGILTYLKYGDLQPPDLLHAMATTKGKVATHAQLSPFTSMSIAKQVCFGYAMSEMEFRFLLIRKYLDFIRLKEILACILTMHLLKNKHTKMDLFFYDHQLI